MRGGTEESFSKMSQEKVWKKALVLLSACIANSFQASYLKLWKDEKKRSGLGLADSSLQELEKTSLYFFLLPLTSLALISSSLPLSPPPLLFSTDLTR